MLNRKGYTLKELIILFAVLAIVFTIGIVKGTYALKDAQNTEEIQTVEQNIIVLAAETYAKMHEDKFQESETYLFCNDLIDEGLLSDNEALGYDNAKIKVTKEGDTYKAEIVE